MLGDNQITFNVGGHDKYVLIKEWLGPSGLSGSQLLGHIYVQLVPCDTGHADAESSMIELNYADAQSVHTIKDVTDRKALAATTREALTLADSWLHQCQTAHWSCDLDSKKAWSPRRLLRYADGIVRVVHTETEPVHGCYAALSHCWGSNADFLVLTDANEKTLSQGVPYSSLPQNFHDALKVVGELNIAYL